MEVVDIFYQNIPKIELHAHINGCIRIQTLIEFCEKYNVSHTDVDLENRTIEEIWKIFALIHKAVRSLSDVKRITKEVIEDFSIDNTIYLELRTTPKSLNDCTKEEYLKGILDTYIECQALFPSIHARLLVSIDRSKGVQEAEENYALFKSLRNIEIYKPFVVGLDYSGNSYMNDFEDYRHIFKEAKELNYKIAIHVGETPEEKTTDETRRIIEFNPERLGHLNYYTPDYLKMVKAQNNIIEVCPTSNFFTKGMNSFDEHHISDFIESELTFTICTDDTAIFNSTLSQEWQIIDHTFKLGKENVKQIIVKAVDYIFDEDVKEEIKEKINKFEVTN